MRRRSRSGRTPRLWLGIGRCRRAGVPAAGPASDSEHPPGDKPFQAPTDIVATPAGLVRLATEAVVSPLSRGTSGEGPARAARPVALTSSGHEITSTSLSASFGPFTDSSAISPIPAT